MKSGERVTHVITESGIRYQRTGEERVPREFEDYLDPETGNVYTQNDAAPETRKRTILRRVGDG